MEHWSEEAHAEEAGLTYQQITDPRSYGAIRG